MKNKTALTFRELIELVESSVKSQRIEKDYADYLECCKDLGISSYTLNLLVQRAKAASQQSYVEEAAPAFWVQKEVVKVRENKSRKPVAKRSKEVLIKYRNSKLLWFFFWLVLLIGLFEAATLYFVNDKRKDAEISLWVTNNRLDSANRRIGQVRSVIDAIPRDTTFSSWTSTNKENNSESSRRYRFYASIGDVLTFNYFVSSEQNYDFLTITLTSNVTADEELVKVSGQVRDKRTKTLKKAGEYSLLVKYKKDGSYSYYDDNGGIQTFHLRRNPQVMALVDSINSIISP